MNNIDTTVFVYRHKSTGEIRCEYLDAVKTVNPKDYHHEATLSPKMWVQYWFDTVSKLREKEDEQHS